MKKTLRYVRNTLLLFVGLAGSQAIAQTVPKNKSRLDLKPKAATPAPMPELSFRPWMKKIGEASREVSLSRSPSITSFYRSQLIAQPARPSTRVEVPAAPVALVAETNRSTETLLPGVEKLFSNEKITISNLYPNPANDYANVDYAIVAPMGEAKISLYSALGSLVGEHLLDRNERRLRIATSDIPNGVYLYQLSLEGKTVVTKKLLVRHH